MAEIDHREKLCDPDRFAARPLTPVADAALEEAARLAGRWEGEYRTMQDATAKVNALASGIRGVSPINDVDPREIEFTWSAEWGEGQLGLADMTRSQMERAASALTSAANAVAGDGLDSVRNVLRAQGTGRGASGAGERRYEPPAPGTAAGLER